MNKPPQPIRQIDIDSVNSLESYVYNLIILMNSMMTLINLQIKAESIGIFDDDEKNLSKAVKMLVRTFFVKTDDLYCHCLDRIGLSPEEFKKKAHTFAANLVDSGRKSVAKKKQVKKP